MEAWAVSQAGLGTLQVRFLIWGNIKSLGGFAPFLWQGWDFVFPRTEFKLRGWKFSFILWISTWSDMNRISLFMSQQGRCTLGNNHSRSERCPHWLSGKTSLEFWGENVEKHQSRQMRDTVLLSQFSYLLLWVAGWYRLWRLNLQVQAPKLGSSLVKAHWSTLVLHKTHKPTMNLSKFLDLTNSHVLDLHSSKLWTWIPYIFISLCIPSLLGDEERKDRYPHMSHNFISSHHPLQSAVWHQQPLSPPCLHLGVFTGFLSHLRGPSVLQHPFRNRLTRVWHAVPNEAALQVYQGLFQSLLHPLPLHPNSWFACSRASQHGAELCKDIHPHFHLADTLDSGPFGYLKSSESALQHTLLWTYQHSVSLTRAQWVHLT